MSQWNQPHRDNAASNDRNRLLYGHATGVQAGGDAATGPMHRGGVNVTTDTYQNDTVMEGFNDQRVSGLQNKVAMLREITIGIGEEVREQNRMLNTMNDDFDTTGSFLNGTVKRFQRMAARQRAGGWMCYMILFVIGTFIFMYLYVKLWR